jgi:hypothetical protein
MVRRAPHQVSGSLIRPDLSCGANFFPEDQTSAPLVLSLPTGDRGFESRSLQRGVYCEPNFRGRSPSMTVSVVFRSGIACRTSTAQRTASTTLASYRQAVTGGLDDPPTDGGQAPSALAVSKVSIES